jgi:hypothetical protein
MRAAFGALAASCSILGTLALAACASYRPGPPEPKPFLERAQTRTDRGVTASAAVLLGPESEVYFGTDLAAHGVQPIWVRIENREDVPYRFAPRAFDPYYFSAGEVAELSSLLLSSEARAALESYLRQELVPDFVDGRATISGFVYAPVDYGAKAATVLLLGDNQARQLEFVLPVPNLDADWMTVDMARLYRPDRIEEIAAGDEPALRTALAALPCCAADAAGTPRGDPLNFALVGRFDILMAALVRAGWDETATLDVDSALVSPLYVFGRHQDAAFQKSRGTIDQRNHLRLWRTPLEYGGQPVWIGQISRDVGVRFTLQTWHLTTHSIGPDVDGERWYLVQDLLAAQAIGRMGYVEGVGIARVDAPRITLGGDPYFTDGLRVVLFIADDPVGAGAIDQLPWSNPPAGKARLELLGGP